MRPLGLCLVGCGRFATFHARAARRLAGSVTLAFASRDPARAEAYRRRFRGVAAFGSYEAAAADDRVDALVFCTPHLLHLDNVRLAAKHGKAALVEKPIADTLDAADRMIAEAAAAGIRFMVAENFHFMPAFVAARRLLATGAIGPVRQIVLAPRGEAVPRDWRTRRAEAGGGILIDGGVHYVRLLHDWGGPIAWVAAVAPPNLIAAMEGEDTAFLLARFEGGAVGVLASSIAAPGLPRLQAGWVTGAAGSLGVDHRGRALWLRRGRRPRIRVFLRDRRGLSAQLAAFVAAVREGRPVPLDPASARADLAVVTAAYRSLATGQGVAVARAGQTGR